MTPRETVIEAITRALVWNARRIPRSARRQKMTAINILYCFLLYFGTAMVVGGLYEPDCGAILIGTLLLVIGAML